MNVNRLAVLLLFVCSLSGCRLYGGHGSTDAVREDISVALASFNNTYDQATRDLAKIRNEPNSAATSLFYEQFRAAVDNQKEQLAISTEVAESAMESGGYRKVSRVVGSLVSENSASKDRYRSILLNAASMHGVNVDNARLASAAPTQAVPAYYQRAVGDNVPSVDEVLAAMTR